MNKENETSLSVKFRSANATASETVLIERVKHLSTGTEIHLQGGTTIVIRPFLYLSQGDKLEFAPSIQQFEQVNKLILEKATGSERKVKIYPPYSKSEIVCVAPHRFEVVFRERISGKDWQSAKLLEQFHYRGKGLNKIVGRRTVLLADSGQHGIIGYGVLAATVAAAKPRFALFDTNFGKQMRSKLINQIVRIPRIVVHPEFRGLGLGTLIAKHLVQYASEYWDIRGYAPIAVEVIASMTDYHHFFEKAGFVNAGYTLGYKNGIIPEYGKGSWEPRPNYRSYDFFENQKPKPYLIYPLDEEVRGKMREKNLLQPVMKGLLHRVVQPVGPITFVNLSITYKANNGLTSRAEEIKDAFGVDATQLFSPVIRDFSFTIDSGDVVLFTGASGSGKSTLVKFLTRHSEQVTSLMDIQGEARGVDHIQVATLDTNWDNSLPLIDQIGKSTKEAIALLNGVGLAEAHLYLKRPCQISDGQRYRFAVARLCDSKKPLWVADDFASTLDPVTAAIVAKGLRKISWKLGSTLVLAAPHAEHFVDSLFPNKLVHLRWGGFALVYSLRLVCEIVDSITRIKVSNMCRHELSNVTIGGMSGTGEIEKLKVIPTLEPNTYELVEIAASGLQQFAALVVNTDQKVGDVIYIGSTGQ